MQGFSEAYAERVRRSCRGVLDALQRAHGQPQQHDERGEGCDVGNSASVLDSLARTLLSQNTTDKTSARAFASLKAAFPSWEQARDAMSVILMATRISARGAGMPTSRMRSCRCAPLVWAVLQTPSVWAV
jgi:endonuclease III